MHHPSLSSAVCSIFCNFLKFTKYYNEIHQRKDAKLNFSFPHLNIRRKLAIINYIVYPCHRLP